MSRLNPSIAALAAAIAVTACVPRAEPPPPAPAPTPAPAPPPPPPPAPAPAVANWADLPPTPGDWSYRQDAAGSVATFGPRGGAAEFTMRCNRQAGQVQLMRRGAAQGGGSMTIRTTSTTKALSLAPVGGQATATVAARDPILDAMGFSRGRVLVAVPSLPQLVMPSWSEILRVTEDCRT